MSPEIWIAFTLTSLALLAMPGPTVMLVVSYAFSGGRKTGLATVPGVTLGDFTAMTISLMGAGAVLAASATLFTILKLCGAAYLVWMGIGLWRSGGENKGFKKNFPVPKMGKLFTNAYVVTALNPKSIIFFVAFVPQFVDPARPVFQQFAILEATFVILAMINTALWVLLADKMKKIFSSNAAVVRANRVGGGLLIGAGVLTAATGTVD
ncbi:MAG: LysE family translocator [Rhodospirillaceae bacterium]|nr:LysE family translocator [Rhodospirillaceae bacterium]